VVHGDSGGNGGVDAENSENEGTSERASVQICRVLLWNGTEAGQAATPRRYRTERDCD